MTQHTKDFIEILNKLKPSKHRYEVFSDWLVMAAASLYAPWKKDQAVENEYLEIANQYTKDELEKIKSIGQPEATPAKENLQVEIKLPSSRELIQGELF
jgi:hypothetical protein